MIHSVAKKLFGSRNDREIKRLLPIVGQINSFESKIAPLSNDQLAGKTAQFRERLSRGEKLDSILPEAFAVVREAGKRILNMRHFDVQMIGGMVLNMGRFAENANGKKKKLSFAHSLFTLNAL